MARDPQEGGAFVFDLVDDDVAGPGAPVATPGTEHAGDPGEDGLAPGGPISGAGRGLRVLAPLAAVLAIVLGTGFALDGIRDGERTERVRDARGGVVDLSAPVEETWSWSGPVGIASEDRWNEVAVLGRLLAFQSDGDLVALDPATGDEAWRLGLGEDPDCAPQGAAGWSDVASSRFVCLSDVGSAREAVVVGPDGVASPERPLAVADTRRYGRPRPGPDGTVLRARRVGPQPRTDADAVECGIAGECTGTVTAGRDLRLRAEDAVTGEERWSLTVPFRSTPAEQCTTWYGTDWDGPADVTDLGEPVDRDGFGARVTGDGVQLYGCGIDAVVTTDGVLLGGGIEPGTGGVEDLRAGGYLGYTWEGRASSTLYAADGSTIGEFDGYLLEPIALDGSGPTTLLAAGDPGTRVPRSGLRSVDLYGTPRWDVPGGPDVQLFLAQAGGAAVVQTGVGQIRALDLATGAARWTWDPADASDERRGDLYVSPWGVFTDGETVLLATETSYGGSGLVALDLVSGEVVWEHRNSGVGAEARIPAPSARLVAVGGNLLEVAPDGVRGLG